VKCGIFFALPGCKFGVKNFKMVIRNKKIIGLISIVAGLAIFVYEGCFFSVAVYGEKTSGEVTGFVLHRNGAKKVEKENNSIKNPFRGRSPFVKFKTTSNQEVEAYSKTLQLFTFSGYHLGDKIMVAYNPRNPQQIFIMNIKELPGVLLILAFGLVLILAGKSYLFPKAKQAILK
jgi:hypothetical protein